MENSEVTDMMAENSSEISAIPVENSEIMDMAVEENNSEAPQTPPIENDSEISEIHVENNNSEISDIPVENSEDMALENNSEISEIPVENSEDMAVENNSEISEIPMENSELTDMTVENNDEEDSEVVKDPQQRDEDEDEENKTGSVKLSRFPVSKIKRIMKNGLGETGVNLVSSESAFLIGKATELFVATVAEQAAAMARASKKKTITSQHLKATIGESEVFSFLEGTLIPDYDF